MSRYNQPSGVGHTQKAVVVGGGGVGKSAITIQFIQVSLCYFISCLLLLLLLMFISSFSFFHILYIGLPCGRVAGWVSAPQRQSRVWLFRLIHRIKIYSWFFCFCVCFWSEDLLYVCWVICSGRWRCERPQPHGMKLKYYCCFMGWPFQRKPQIDKNITKSVNADGACLYSVVARPRAITFISHTMLLWTSEYTYYIPWDDGWHASTNVQLAFNNHYNPSDLLAVRNWPLSNDAIPMLNVYLWVVWDERIQAVRVCVCVYWLRSEKKCVRMADLLKT